MYILKLLEDYYKSEGLKSEWLFVNKRGRIHNRAMDLRIRRYCHLTSMDKENRRIVNIGLNIRTAEKSS